MSDTPKQHGQITLEESETLHKEALAKGRYSPAVDKWKYKQRETPMELTLESILNFGKHKGKQIEDLIVDEPGYIKWLCEKEVRPFDEEALARFADEGLI